MSTSGAGTWYGYRVSDRFVLTDLLRDTQYDSEGAPEDYEPRSAVARLPMTLASARERAAEWKEVLRWNSR